MRAMMSNTSTDTDYIKSTMSMLTKEIFTFSH